jgi:spore germination cell wall hydrolase CwlJ-like protein
MAKMKVVRLSDLPEEEVDAYVNGFELDGYRLIQKYRQPDGLWTIEVGKTSQPAPAAPAPAAPLPANAQPAVPVQGNAASTDMLTLARTIYGEAAGEPWMGKEAVAHVVLNRARSGRYPASVTEVCLQPKQFSCWNANDPNFPKIRNLQPGADTVFDNCCEIAGKALHGLLNDPTGGALHYHADYIDKPSWVVRSPNAKLTAMIGHHLFYTGIA